MEPEDFKAVIYNVLEKELGVNVTKIRFHVVHRVGKKIHGKRRPIIARFVCREDREEFITRVDAYITENYVKTRAIQEERKVLIKAPQEHGLSHAKVKGGLLFINNGRYDSKSIPEYLK